MLDYILPVLEQGKIVKEELLRSCLKIFQKATYIRHGVSKMKAN